MPRNNEDSVASCHEHTIDALSILATGTGKLQARLSDAALSIAMLESGDFPGDLAPRFRAIDDALSAGGSFEETTSQMSDEQARGVAEQIYSLAVEVIQRNAIEDPD